MLYKAYSLSAEVLGKNIKTYISGMGAFEMMGKNILISSGIDEDPKDDVWYNHQIFLNALKDISAKTGPNTISLIGSRIAEGAKFPDNVDSFEKALEHLGEAYRVNHKGDTKSYKRCIKMGDNMYKIVVETPYPCDLDTGYLKGLAERFGIRAVITHDDTQPCRKIGAESCTYVIKW